MGLALVEDRSNALDTPALPAQVLAILEAAATPDTGALRKTLEGLDGQLLEAGCVPGGQELAVARALMSLACYFAERRDDDQTANVIAAAVTHFLRVRAPELFGALVAESDPRAKRLLHRPDNPSAAPTRPRAAAGINLRRR